MAHEISGLALNTGMRLREILSLRWENVSLAKRLICLPKTKNKDLRYIDMNRLVYKALKELKSMNSTAIFVFPDRQGRPFGSIRTAFLRTRERAGISDSFRFHDLRHTFASRLVMNGVDLRTVQELMGHKDIKMTMRYTHLSAAHKRQAVETLAQKSDSIGTRQAPERLTAFGVSSNSLK
jgi:integrase